MPTLLNYKGQTYPVVTLENLTPGEAAAIEGVAGLTFQRIRRIMASCVCDHNATAHRHEDSETDASCNECRCDEFEADMPVAVATALSWVAIKRVDRTVKYADVAGTTFGEFEWTSGDDEPDPTGPPSAAG